MAMTPRLEAEDEKVPTLLAEAEGVNKQEATVRAICEAAARKIREDKVRHLSAAARGTYADLPDRPARLTKPTRHRGRMGTFGSTRSVMSLAHT